MTDQSKSEMKHTKLPWKAVEHSWEQTSIYDQNGTLIATLTISDEVTEKNQDEYESEMDAHASLIVRAVNSHYALVELCGQVILAHEQGECKLPADIVSGAYAALKLAEAE